MTIHPLYLITWKDAESDCKWQDMDEIKKWAEKDYVVRDIGWIIHENKKHIVICSQIGDEGGFGNKTKIPIGWVISRKKLTFKIERK